MVEQEDRLVGPRHFILPPPTQSHGQALRHILDILHIQGVFSMGGLLRFILPMPSSRLTIGRATKDIWHGNGASREILLRLILTSQRLQRFRRPLWPVAFPVLFCSLVVQVLLLRTTQTSSGTKAMTFFILAVLVRKPKFI